jgi:hypothetical protein
VQVEHRRSGRGALFGVPAQQYLCAVASGGVIVGDRNIGGRGLGGGRLGHDRFDRRAPGLHITGWRRHDSGHGFSHRRKGSRYLGVDGERQESLNSSCGVGRRIPTAIGRVDKGAGRPPDAERVGLAGRPAGLGPPGGHQRRFDVADGDLPPQRPEQPAGQLAKAVLLTRGRSVDDECSITAALTPAGRPLLHRVLLGHVHLVHGMPLALLPRDVGACTGPGPRPIPQARRVATAAPTASS